MKFSLVGSYNLADGYLGAAQALRKEGHEVLFVPAQKYMGENPATHIDLLIKDLEEQSPDIVLWWRAETLTSRQLGFIRYKIQGPKFIMYSWDDPHQWEAHKDLPQKMSFFDIAFTCCMGSVSDYEAARCKGVYCPPGFDPTIHYPEEDENYSCDVSLVCTNLYDGGELTRYPHVSRKALIDLILDQAPELNLRLYGPEDFGVVFPDIYKGWMPFDESRKVFRNSRINLCTHIRPDGFMYINERVTQILGSGGLLLVDGVNGMEKLLSPEENYLILDLSSKTSFVNQIKEVLENYDKYEGIRENGYQKAKGLLSWDCWAAIILKEILGSA